MPQYDDVLSMLSFQVFINDTVVKMARKSVKGCLHHDIQIQDETARELFAIQLEHGTMMVAFQYNTFKMAK